MLSKSLPMIRGRWRRWAVVVPVAVLVLASVACADTKVIDAAASTAGVDPASASSGERPVPAPVRSPLTAAERAGATAAWPAARLIAKADMDIRWTEGPRLVGYAHTKSDEWLKSGAIDPPDPKASLATRPLPQFYDVFVVRGSGTWECRSPAGNCPVAAPGPIHLAYVISSDGQPYETVSWVDEQAPYDIASVGLPAEEFNLD